MTEIKYLKGFIVYTLCAALAGLLAGAIQGGILGFILGAAGVSLKVIPYITGCTGFIVGAFISFFIFRWVIRKYILSQIANGEEHEQAEPGIGGDRVNPPLQR